MKGLRYLFFTTVKNSIKELVKHPAKLVMVLFFVLLIGMMVVSSLAAPLPANERRDPKEVRTTDFPPARPFIPWRT